MASPQVSVAKKIALHTVKASDSARLGALAGALSDDSSYLDHQPDAVLSPATPTSMCNFECLQQWQNPKIGPTRLDQRSGCLLSWPLPVSWLRRTLSSCECLASTEQNLTSFNTALHQHRALGDLVKACMHAASCLCARSREPLAMLVHMRAGLLLVRSSGLRT